VAALHALWDDDAEATLGYKKIGHGNVMPA
jgi:hypothetical protein